jgi:flagellar biosynthesis/type III secretory pathway protein FliH
MAVIQFLKGIFDTIKAKKAASQPLTADEQTILDKGPEIEKELSAAKDAAAEALAESQKAAAEIENKGANDALDVLNGEGGSKMKWILIIVVVIVILYLFLKRK